VIRSTADPARRSDRGRGSASRRWRRRREEPLAVAAEHLTIIEFAWSGRLGIQPVLLIERTLLH
jgi:hypothetical protein